jgi:hypothetical protein
LKPGENKVQRKMFGHKRVVRGNSRKLSNEKTNNVPYHHKIARIKKTKVITGEKGLIENTHTHTYIYIHMEG